jgi:hypothetical protein
VLREAVPLFEGARVFVKSDAEHLRGEGKDVRNIAGWITGAKFVEGKAVDTGRVVGQLHLSAAVSGIRTLVADAWKRGKRDLVGLSVDALGKATTAMREGRKVREAQRITKVASVDLIVEPGAGGQLIRMVESFNSEEQDDTMLRKKMLDTIQAKAPKAFAKIDAEKITDDALLVAFHEAVDNPGTTRERCSWHRHPGGIGRRGRGPGHARPGPRGNADDRGARLRAHQGRRVEPAPRREGEAGRGVRLP